MTLVGMATLALTRPQCHTLVTAGTPANDMGEAT